MNNLQPLKAEKRISSIDTLRGVALLGILLINIAGMALPDPAYFDPSLSGGHTGWNLKVFFINSMFFEGTMRGLFSLLFGAGIVLFVNVKEDSGNRFELLEVWYRRLIWLIVIGMIHAYILLWPEEILFAYGMIGLLLFPFRRLSPEKLIGISAAIVLVGVFLNVQDANTSKREQKHYFDAVSLIERGEEIPYETLLDYYSWLEKYAVMKPSAEILESRMERMQNGYADAFKEQKKKSYFFESEYHYRHNYIDILSMMLLGIALFKLRILHAEKSSRYYFLMILIGYGIGLSINYFETTSYINSNFALIKYYELLRTYDLGRIPTMMGHIGLIMLFCKSNLIPFLKSALSAVGRMALTNYIMHTIIASIIFTGFAQYGKWQRFELYYLVAAIWIFQLILSPIWLRYFRFGPVEWLWRSLSYQKRQPFFKK
ncbi:MAG: DUF418 domain-containing protein [Bacteroidales bacterium]|nr:DUF418 domain-containing protein [Bacteroidales bacterium]